jgi:aspartate kinase
MRIIVQKFGGTSVRTPAQREQAAQWVVRALEEGTQPVVVVSAMGREGDPYATDTLLGLAEGLPPRDSDLLASCGEVIAAAVMTAVLRQNGVEARALTGAEAGIVTDGDFGQARILRVDAEPLKELLAAGIVPVVAGYQGRSADGEVTTLGRGGSDTTAAALGAALEAEVVDIFTDVDGIKTADPRIVPTARTLSCLAYEEVFQLANLGARVVHPRAVEIARQFEVPLRVRSTFLEGSMGTLVSRSVPGMDPGARRHPENAVSGITYLDGIVQIEATPASREDPSWALLVFQHLGAAGISVDLINVFPERVYFTVAARHEARTRELLEGLALSASVRRDRAKVSVVGSAIHGLPGVMARVMAALAAVGVTVLQSADSYSTISCLVERHDMERAVRALHTHFNLDGEPEAGD